MATKAFREEVNKDKEVEKAEEAVERDKTGVKPNPNHNPNQTKGIKPKEVLQEEVEEEEEGVGEDNEQVPPQACISIRSVPIR